MLLPSPFQKILKWIHITFASVLLGSLVSMTYLFFIKEISSTGSREDYFIFILFDILITYSFFLLIITAFIYGIFTKWKFFLHHWLILKWTLVIILLIMVWFGWGPSINGLIALTDGQFRIAAAYQEYLGTNQFAFILTILALFVVWIIFLISILKPWGIRKSKKM